MRTIPLLLAAALLVAACGDDSEDVGTTSPSGSEDRPPATLPDGATPGGAPGDLFVEVATVGGFLPVEAATRQLPSVAVYGDGTVLAPGAITLQYPGPAVLPLLRGSLDEGQLGELLRDAAEAGLLADPDVGEQSDIPIADATSTRVTVVVDGEEHVVEAYALQEADGGSLSEDQRLARDALVDFVATVSSAAVAAEAPYDPERYRVVAGRPLDASSDVEPPPNELAWPGDLPQPKQGECLALAGADADALEALLPQASEITRWIVGDGAVSLAIRPLLPHEPDC